MLPLRAASVAFKRAKMQTGMAPISRAISNVGAEFGEVSANNGAPRYPSLWDKWYPYEPVPCSPKMGMYKVSCEQGQVYHFCTCGESRNQPWCEDGGSGACSVNPKFHSMLYQPRYSGTKYLCGCKKSPQVLWCNGSCALLYADVFTPSAMAFAFGASFAGSVFLTWFMHP